MGEGNGAFLRGGAKRSQGPKLKLGGGAPPGKRSFGRKKRTAERCIFSVWLRKCPKKNAERIKNQNLVEIHVFAWISTKNEWFLISIEELALAKLCIYTKISLVLDALIRFFTVDTVKMQRPAAPNRGRLNTKDR